MWNTHGKLTECTRRVVKHTVFVHHRAWVVLNQMGRHDGEGIHKHLFPHRKFR